MSLIVMVGACIGLFMLLRSLKGGKLALRGGFLIERNTAPGFYWASIGFLLLCFGFLVVRSAWDTWHWLPAVCEGIWKVGACVVSTARCAELQ